MILPNLCCSIRVEPGMRCVSVVVPHPTYLPETSWKCMNTDCGRLVVDCYTLELMQRGYLMHERGPIIMSVEVSGLDTEVQDYIDSINLDMFQDPPTNLKHSSVEHCSLE